MNEPRRLIVYKDVTEAPADLVVGERVVLVRGDGPREGEVMGHATITENDPVRGLAFRVLTSDRRGEER